MADKILKSLNFGGADNYFPLPLVTAADNDKILSVVNGEWAAIDAPVGGGGSGSYVWTKQGMSENTTEDTTGGTYTLTTADDSRPSSEIEYASAAPTYDSAKRQWVFTNPTVVTIVNSNDTLPAISGNVYCRVTSEPNVWYRVTSFNKSSSSPYQKNMSYTVKYTAKVDWAKRYLTDKVEDAYPLDDWLDDGYYYKQIVADPIVEGGGATWTQSNNTNGKFYSVYCSNGIWVAGGYEIGLYYSTDGGVTWTQSNITFGDFYSIYYSNGVWVAGSYNLGLYYSTDGGATWTRSNITNGAFRSVYYFNGIWVAGSAGGDINGLYYSTDGKTWTQSNNTSGTFRSVYYSNGIWVAAGTGNIGLYYSTDGKTWTQSNITSGSFYSVYYSNGIWVAGGASDNGLYYSTNGKTWTKSNKTDISLWSVYGSDGIWVAATSGNGLYYSTDGKTWTKSTLPNAPYGSFYSVYYSNGIWVAGSGSGYGLYYSTDGGATWTKSNITSGEVYSVYYSNGVWVAGSFSSHGLYYSETIPVEVDF